MKVIPLVIPHINVQMFYDLAKKAGYEVAGPVENTRYNPSDFEKFLSGVSAFKTPNDTFKETLRNYNTGKHLHFVFAVVADLETILESMELSTLDHTVMKTQKNHLRFAIVSGTINQFRHAMLACSDTPNPELAAIFNEIYLHFEANGFREVFNFKKKPRKDNTFRLEHK